MSVLLPGKGLQAADWLSVGNCEFRARFMPVVVPAVRWAI